jgi:hypothetical protein
LVALAGSYNVIADQGATLSFALVKRDHRKRVTPFDAVEVRMQVRPSDESPVVVLEASTVNGRILADGYDGRIDVIVPAEVMQDVRAGEYVYDLEIEYADGSVERLIRGRFTVRRERTR